MVTENINVIVSGLVGVESAERGAGVSVLVAYDEANDIYVPLTCSPDGRLFTSGG